MDLIKQFPKLKGFDTHGVELTDRIAEGEKGKQAVGSCPFCEYKKARFFINVKTRNWDCKICGLSGGFGKFLELVAAKNIQNAKGRPLLILAKDRGVTPKTLRRWEVGWNGKFYTIPVHGPKSLLDLKRYRIGKRLVITPGGKNWMTGYERFLDRKVKTIYVIEGEWDGMVWDEILRKLHKDGTVISVPASIFKAEWNQGFQGKDVRLIYDNDEAGEKGEARAFENIQHIARSLQTVRWPVGLPETYDLRDLFKDKDGDHQRTYVTINKLFNDRPRQEAKEPKGKPKGKLKGKGLKQEIVTERYRKWMYLPDPTVLDILFGTILGNRLPGEPIWLFLMAPPSGGKSELLMSMSKAPLIFPMTSLTPHALISGANFTGGGDPSLIPKLDGKVLVIKDFTAILNMNPTNRDEIFGILRDAYDGSIVKPFGNNVLRVYESTFGMVAGVTPAIEAFQRVHASLGERFVRFRMQGFKGISEQDVILRALSNINQEDDMRGDLQGIADKVLEREINARDALGIDKHMARRIAGLAQWVSSMRAIVVREKYTNEVMYKPFKEIGTRLAKQFGKLAQGIGFYRQIDKLGEDEYRILVKVARDTAPDRVEDIVRNLSIQPNKSKYLSTKDIANLTRMPDGTTRTLLQDLTLLRVTQKDAHSGHAGRWRLSPQMVKLMKPLGIYDDEVRKRKAKRRKT